MKEIRLWRNHHNVPGGVAPATVASPDMISMEIRGNLTIHYSVR